MLLTSACRQSRTLSCGLSLGSDPEGVQGDPAESVGAGHGGCEMPTDACGYLGMLGACGEPHPTISAENPHALKPQGSFLFGESLHELL